jgi:hypothetical protein
MSQKDTELERYENEDEVRELITLLKAAQPPSELRAPSDFHAKVMRRIAQLPPHTGLLARWRNLHSRGDDSWFVRALRTFSSVVWHPAFAYGLVFLIGLVALRPYFSGPENSMEPAVLTPATDRSLKELLEGPTRSPQATGQAPIQEAAADFLRKTYRAAYETRAISTLAQIWPMSQEWRDYLTRLFAHSRDLTVLLDVTGKAVQVKDKGQVVAPFAYAITVVDQQGEFSIKGPFFCIADLQLLSDSGRWVIQDLREDPQHRGSCRPQVNLTK